MWGFLFLNSSLFGRAPSPAKNKDWKLGVGLSPLALFCSCLTKKELKQWLNPSRGGIEKKGAR
jgi:hypothetical protein